MKTTQRLEPLSEDPSAHFDPWWLPPSRKASRQQDALAALDATLSGGLEQPSIDEYTHSQTCS